MLTSDLIDKLLEPVSEAEPSGPDLEYDVDFMQLAVAAKGKPEQQFGDTIIAAVEPEWNQIEQQALTLLQRSKDVRTAILLLRAVTHTQGLEGAVAGLQLMCGLLEGFWDSLHPQLDADDDNDPTMRLNALAALGDGSTVVHDLYNASLGTAPGLGPIRVYDLAVARGAVPTPEGNSLSAAAVQGGLDDILPSAPATVQAMRTLGDLLQRITDIIGERTNGTPPDLDRPLAIARLLRDAAPEETTADDQPAAAETDAEAPPSDGAITPPATAAPRVAAPGEIRSRQDVLKTLDRIIHYLQQAEPGNPAPLLLRRAKQLIGVSFMDIMSNLAPDALDAIERIAGQQTESADSSESDDSSES